MMDSYDHLSKCVAKLWAEAFGDDDEFIDRFIRHHFSPQRVRTIEIEDSPAAMLHLIPFSSEETRYVYIYAVATAERFRSLGLMSELMQRALREIDLSGATAILIPTPDQERLRRFYEKFGFEGSIPVKFHSRDGFDFGTGDPSTDLAMVRRTDKDRPLPDKLKLTLVEDI